MAKEIYADIVSNIHWCGNMVKIDLASYTPENGKQTTPEITDRLVMPPAGLLALADSANTLIEKLVAAGVLQKTDKK